MSAVRHLYIHLPFCAHRCGYCDFVTVVGRGDEHAGYVDALLVELDRERHVLADRLETVFIGGGTPTFTEPGALARLLDGLPGAPEVSAEANPESVTPELARTLAEGGVSRVSLGAQSFQPQLLRVLERRASADDIRRAVHTLRDVCFDNVSLDLIYGIPGQSASDLRHDLAQALALEPEHLSWYELEAKPGTRFTHAWSDELDRQAEAMEEYIETVVAGVTAAGYRWYETASFCAVSEGSSGRDLRAKHNLGYWHGSDYLGLGVGAVSTLGAERRRNAPSLGRYVEAVRRGDDPPREYERLDAGTKARERVMLGLRLDEPLALDGIEEVLDLEEVDRLRRRGLLEVIDRDGKAAALSLTPRGRLLGDAVTAAVLTG